MSPQWQQFIARFEAFSDHFINISSQYEASTKLNQFSSANGNAAGGAVKKKNSMQQKKPPAIIT